MELLPYVHVVDGVNAHAFLIVADRLALIDAGTPNNSRRIMAYIRQIGRDPAELSHIILTHHHLDHAGSAARIRAATGAEVVVHRNDAPYVTGERKPPRFPGIGGIGYEMMTRVLLPHGSPCPIDVMVEDNDVLPVFTDDGGLTVIHTPGHTAGHIALYQPKRGILFTGDAIAAFRGNVAPPTEFFCEDLPRVPGSIKKMAALKPEVACFAHGQACVKNVGEMLAEVAARV